MDVEKTLKDLVALGLHKGEKYGEGHAAYALGYVESAVRSAMGRLSPRQQKIVLEDIQSFIEWERGKAK